MVHRLRHTVTGGFAALALLLLSPGARVGRAGIDAPLAAILDRAGTYVRQFEQQFAVVLSDETYDQRQHLSQIVDGAPRSRGAQRKLHSELLFMWMPEAQEWLTVRTVLRVNGAPIAESRDRLERALAETDPGRLARLRRLRDEGARFNIGQIVRNFNDPTLALQFLDPVYQPRFTFTLSARRRVNGVDAWQLAFDEYRSPPVVDSDGHDSFSEGSVWVAVSDAAVVRTSARWEDARTNTRANMVVSYRRDPKLEMWVPARMEESYAQNRLVSSEGRPPRFGTVNEQIECVATYSNFRRFETSGRLVPPK